MIVGKHQVTFIPAI